jgi:hypothetical protein
MKLEFFQQIFGKKAKIPNFIKIHPVGAELFHSEGQTDMTNLTVAFRNFANAPKIVLNTFLLKIHVCIYISHNWHVKMY